MGIIFKENFLGDVLVGLQWVVSEGQMQLRKIGNFLFKLSKRQF
jgi:hypothetical protein